MPKVIFQEPIKIKNKVDFQSSSLILVKVKGS